MTATLVQTIQTSQWNPASPDPSGIVYLPGPGRLEIADSEVDETTGAGYHGVNLWQITLSGAVQDTGTTHTPGPAFSKEPTGLGFDPATNTLFISDDDKRNVFIDKPGSDGRFGTSDDTVTSIDAGAYGSTDTEDPEFDTTSGNPTSGHLFFLDGVGTEVYDINPVNGIFGDGNDVVTHFDVGFLGPTDFEGLGSDRAANTLLVGARKTKMIFEVTKSGTLVRTIDASGIPGMSHISGLGMAPASDGSGRMDYWIVDRQVDNGSNPSENDGKLFEITIPPSSNNPPNVTNPGTKTNTVGDSVSFQIQATDPDGDAIASYGATSLPTGLSVSTSTGLITGATTTAGTYTVTISATDSKGATGSTSFTWDVTVNTPSVLDIPVATSSDDAEERVSTGSVKLTSTDLELVTDGTRLQTVGMRFAGVSVPKGATITHAWVQFEVDEVSTGAASLTVQAEAADNPATFAALSRNISSRARTVTSVGWVPAPWPTIQVAGPDQRTPELIAVIQEIVNRTGWASGNAVVIIITGSGRRTAEAFDGTRAPVLHIEYTV